MVLKLVRTSNWIDINPRESIPPEASRGGTGNLRFPLHFTYLGATLLPFLITCYIGRYLITENITPCGSIRAANRPTFGMSVGGISTLPPSSSALRAVASTSSTVM